MEAAGDEEYPEIKSNLCQNDERLAFSPLESQKMLTLFPQENQTYIKTAYQ